LRRTDFDASLCIQNKAGGLDGTRIKRQTMLDQSARFWYPFTASTVLARKLVPFLLFTLGIGLFLWAGREYYYWKRPWAILPAAALGALCWWAAAYFFTLLPEVYADDKGLRVRRWGLFWWHIPWASVAGVQETARIDLLGWVESFYTVYRWRALAGRKGRIRREWHRRTVRAFRFSGHIRDSQRLLTLIEKQSNAKGLDQDTDRIADQERDTSAPSRYAGHGRESQRRTRRVFTIALLLFVIALLVYVPMLARGPLGGDAGEFQTAAKVWGLSHPTGYPLYMLLLKLWGLLPVGTVASRTNLLSAVLAAATVVLLYLLLELVTRQTPSSIVSALVLAVSPLFWSQALITSKYTLNAFLLTVVLIAAVYWAERPQRQRLCLLGLAYGLSLAHHRTMLLFAPGLIGYLLWVDRGIWKSRRNWLAVFCFALPLGLYTILPLFTAFGRPLSNWWPMTPAEWLVYLTARGHLGDAQATVAPLAERLAFYARTLVGQFTIPGLILSAGGWFWLVRRQPALAFLLTVSFLLHGTSSMAYYLDARNQVFFLPSFILIALMFGIGAGALLQWLRTRPRMSIGTTAVLVAVASLALCLLPAHLFLHNYSVMHHTHREGQALTVWRQNLQRGEQAGRLALMGLQEMALGGTVVGDWEQVTPLRYYQWVEGWRPDVEILYPIARLEEASVTGRPLYVARTYPGLADRWHPSASGPLIALQSEPEFDLPSDASPLDIGLDGLFELAGVTPGTASAYPGDVVPLTLYWRAVQTPVHDYSVSLRLFDMGGQEIFKVDSQHPVLGTYPTSRWTAGEVVGDYYEIVLPIDLLPGTYQWGVILYRTLPDGGWENLGIDGGDGEIAMGGVVEVQEP
jgi:hypothetical protein